MKNILYTKLLRPKSKSLVRRNFNIEDKISRIKDNKITVVEGGAAVGKSSLISNYIASKSSYMWLSLDKSCDDVSYFWTYILHGLKGDIQDLNFYIDMINPLVNRDDIFELLSSLINELIGEVDMFIVLDDFHYIEDEFLLKTIGYFISNSSDNLHFILISRREIPIYLGNIIMKGGVVNIKGEDFALSLEETEEFIKNSISTPISKELIKEIYFSTEGWVGAIKLLLTVLQSRKNIENIPRNNKVFIDYINNEIIKSLSSEEVDFLIKTSPLEYVNPQIYKYIENKDGYEIIEKLIEKNMLIIAIDEEKRIFRYHNLLRAYLLELFSKLKENSRNEVIDKIINFLISEGNYDEAISLLLEWKNYDKALVIFEKNAHKIVSTKLINTFPLNFYEKSPDLAIISTFFNYLNLDYERCAQIVNAVGASPESNLLRSIKIFNIIVDNSKVDDFEFHLPKEIDEDLNILTKVIYYILYSTICRFTGEYVYGLETTELIKKHNKELKNSYVDLLCEYNIVALQEDMGKLYEGEKGFEKLNKSISNKKYKACFEIFRSVGLPGIYIKQLRYNEADELLREAQEILDNLQGRFAYASLERSIVYNVAEVRYIQEDIDECERLLNYIVDKSKDNYSYLEMLSLKIRLLSTEGRVKNDEYNDFVRVYEKDYDNFLYLGKVRLTYAIVLFNIERYDESLDVINKIIFSSRKNREGYLLVYGLVWKVVLLDKLKINDEREYINTLKEAIFYSRDEDILFPYFTNRKYLKDIMKRFELRLLEDKENGEFLKKLRYFIEIKDEVEFLTSREIEVLKALTEGLSNKEIGEKLFISISTVKTHIINIYSKLGVKNRVEAVNEAKSLKYK